ncbi:MAG: CgeB family protein [Bacteriovoracaceae bacterium]|nr:CgeB family protein [Bacteriovoracaceae bacterium]
MICLVEMPRMLQCGVSRICLLRYQEEPIIDSVAAGLQKIGHETKTIIFDRKDLAVESIKKEIETFKPDACITHNFYVFDAYDPDHFLEAYLKERQIPCVAWFWDSPTGSGSSGTVERFLYGSISDNIVNVATDSWDFEFLKKRDIRTDFLGLAVADEFVAYTETLSKKVSSPYSFDVSFSGKPMGISFEKPLENEDDILDFYRDRLINDLVYKMNFKDLPSGVAEAQTKRFVDCFGPAIITFFSGLYSSVSEYEAAKSIFLQRLKTFYEQAWVNRFLSVFGLIDFTYSWYQLNIYLHRLKEFNVAVYGGNLWADALLPGYGRPSPRLSQNELLDCFHFSKISFCLTKWHFRNMAHERVFIAYGCGGFPITDFRSDLLKFFDKDEIVMYKNFEEAKDLIRFYLKNETERKRIAEKGKIKVLGEHTYSIRAKQLMQILNKHFGVSLK